MTSAPLHDVRVLAIEQYGAGPWGTMQLADLGADVIKLEDPTVGGDVSRHVPPFQEDESSLFFETFNRGKQSFSLDLRHPQARPVFEDLVRSVDAVFSNLRGDQARQARSWRYEQLRGGQPAHCVLFSLPPGSAPPDPGAARGHMTTRCRVWRAGRASPANPTARRPKADCRSRGLLRRIRRSARDTRRRRPGAPAPRRAAAATSTCRCSRWRSRSSPTSGLGSPRAATSRCGAATRRTSPSCRSKTSRPPTAGIVIACPKADAVGKALRRHRSTKS